jgi:hypothetical protein
MELMQAELRTQKKEAAVEHAATTNRLELAIKGSQPQVELLLSVGLLFSVFELENFVQMQKKPRGLRQPRSICRSSMKVGSSVQ